MFFYSQCNAHMWWIHLLVRRTLPLKDRVLLLERVLRAVGSFQYSQRCKPLLVSTYFQQGDCVVYATISSSDRPLSPLIAIISRRGIMFTYTRVDSTEMVKEVLNTVGFTPHPFDLRFYE